MKLIINVDDAGLHPAVNRAVEILAEKGLCTSASIVANGLAVKSATALEGVSLGVHLDILRGRPVSHWQNVTSLVDKNGAFLMDPVILFQRYAAGKVDHMEVEKEWRAQIEHIMSLGVKPTHLTSHKHVHGWPSLTRMAVNLAKEYGIDWIRKPEECSEISKLDKSIYQSKFLNVCGYFDRELDGVNWTDVLWSAVDHDGAMSPERFVVYLDNCGDVKPDSVLELGCGAGMITAGDPPIPPEYDPTKISAVWRDQFRSLAEDAWPEAIKMLGAELVTYSELPKFVE
ncbi:ChbG/HpnK family deacetylase [Pseudodesulfovibrio sp. zrk46]|uniref:ChbG/HpnK family deacetylase n=1 Tax=Pseudodesulfovibrio sp. zrk46 TaxID=2725288 RepID=UPI00144953EF|nr:ChbG/HpnK family deacetylase [Pseudodesulfovibrio sp. zrk46]QJB56018.1 ChbG/HpnK family deacetylase [Pseudodesulfovibrio sp. zrk46]